MSASPPRAAVLAVDGGNSKTDVALVAADGSLLAAVRGPTSSHQAVGLERGMAVLAGLLADAAHAAGLAAGSGPVAPLGIHTLAGADFPADLSLLRRALRSRGFATEDVVLNDTFAALRAGTTRPWGVALICGQGINGAAVAPDGRTARFDGVGEISGDWGGGGSVGMAGLGAAVRARDGRGPATSLASLVPAHFGLRSARAVTLALYTDRLARERVSELSPVVFGAATEGDEVARRIVDDLADELVAMATALIRRLRMRRLDVEVVLGGGVFRAEDPAFYGRIEAGVRDAAPRARLVRLTVPPVVGTALIGLDRLGGLPPSAETALRTAIGRWHALVVPSA